MATTAELVSIGLKIAKLIINLVVLILYRVGDHSYFLGIGGTWDLNEERTADCEIVASGVFVGFFIYTSVQLIASLIGDTVDKSELSDTTMNIIGALMWIGTGGVALHYWVAYKSDYEYIDVKMEKGCGIAMGSLCVFSGILYIVDTFMALRKINQGKRY